MIYAYGICEPEVAAASRRLRGLGGATLRTLEGDGVAAVYSRHRSLRPRPSLEFVLAHERVVEAIMSHGDVLPMRFGTQLASEERLAEALAERREALLRALERVHGHVELGLRVISESTSEGAHTHQSGREYLLARAAQHRRADVAARELHAPLASLAAASVVRERPGPPAVLAAAYLVDHRRVDEFRARAEELAARQEQLRVVVTGPWPPYNFSAERPR